ncbi:Zn(2)-C6 fungal-type domain-containing protein [Mycena kentingensis (nom. inval.)]|nr:Zn(2)-C6 fungal-type domain-containing protein [Mycena kentingensis (nom. inval.)]
MSQSSFPLGGAPLQRGKACLNCRRRKTKCDGVRPVCGPCSRHSTLDDCEFDDAGPADSQMLEEQIRVIQQRIDELQNPAARSSHRAGGSSSNKNNMQLGPLLSHFRTSANALSAKVAELPPFVLQALAHNFLHNAPSFGFFLDTQAFHAAIQSPSSASNTNTPLPPVLLDVMHLWGIHLATDPRIAASRAQYEPALLAHALRSTAGALTSAHPRTLLHAAQASVLLATYFLRNARMVEGRYHASAAVGIVLSGGWHRLPAGGANINRLRGEEGRMLKEQVAAFWGVLTVDNVWSGANGWASNVVYGPGGLDIATPWPSENPPGEFVCLSMPMDSAHPSPDPSQSGTLPRFLADLPDYADCPAALRIAGFTAALPPVQHKTVLTTHLVARLACIRLHETGTSPAYNSRARMLTAAREVVQILMNPTVAEEAKGGAVDPVIAPILARVCMVLISEITAMQRVPQQQQNPVVLQSVLDALKFLVQVMGVMAAQFKLMGTSASAPSHPTGLASYTPTVALPTTIALPPPLSPNTGSEHAEDEDREEGKREREDDGEDEPPKKRRRRQALSCTEGLSLPLPPLSSVSAPLTTSYPSPAHSSSQLSRARTSSPTDRQLPPPPSPERNRRRASASAGAYQPTYAPFPPTPLRPLLPRASTSSVLAIASSGGGRGGASGSGAGRTSGRDAGEEARRPGTAGAETSGHRAAASEGGTNTNALQDSDDHAGERPTSGGRQPASASLLDAIELPLPHGFQTVRVLRVGVGIPALDEDMFEGSDRFLAEPRFLSAKKNASAKLALPRSLLGLPCPPIARSSRAELKPDHNSLRPLSPPFVVVVEQQCFAVSGNSR